MSRPRKRRQIGQPPKASYFKPRGVPLSQLREVLLPLEGLEALRLAEVEGLEQGAAARRMGVSRPTFSRVLAQARQRVALALVKGWALRIAGGDYELAPEPGLASPPDPAGRPSPLETPAPYPENLDITRRDLKGEP
jgi:uncharacterized protein